MAIFTRTRRATPPPQPQTAPVLSYSNPSASITVTRVGDTWELRIEPQNGPQGVNGRFVFDSREPAVNAAKWLAYKDLTGIPRPGMAWVELVDAINDRRERLSLGRCEQELTGLTDAVIEHVLEVHYRQVLTSKDGRRMWSKLLRDAATVERAEQIRRDAR